MRALVADDEAVVRSALRLFLEQHFGAQVLSEASLPVMRARCPKMKIVVLNGRPESRRAAFEGGADAFVSKGGSPEELLATLGSLKMLSKQHRQADDTSGDPGEGETPRQTRSE